MKPKVLLSIVMMLGLVSLVSASSQYKCYPELTKVWNNNCARPFDLETTDLVMEAGNKTYTDLLVSKWTNSLIRVRAVDNADDNSFFVYANGVPIYVFPDSVDDGSTVVRDHVFYLYNTAWTNIPPYNIPSHTKSKILPTTYANGVDQITLKVWAFRNGVTVDEVEVISGLTHTYSPYYLIE